MSDYDKKVLHVFINGQLVPVDLYVLEDTGAVTFLKPLAEISPNAPIDPTTGKPVYWVIFEYEYHP